MRASCLSLVVEDEYLSRKGGFVEAFIVWHDEHSGLESCLSVSSRWSH